MSPAPVFRKKNSIVSGQDEGFVLLTRPWRETSLMVEVFTREHGRRLMIARGARRPQSLLRGHLLPFHRLVWHWRGRGEVVNIASVEWQGKISFIPRQALLSAHYLNELLFRLLPSHDPHPALFDGYANTLQAMSSMTDRALTSHYLQACLRRFEVVLLQEIGYGINVSHTCDDHAPILPHAHYHYLHGNGFSALPAPINPDDISLAKKTSTSIRGDAILEMAQWLSGKITTESDTSPPHDDEIILRLTQQRQLLRELLQHHLTHPLTTRQLAQDIQRLQQSAYLPAATR